MPLNRVAFETNLRDTLQVIACCMPLSQAEVTLPGAHWMAENRMTKPVPAVARDTSEFGLRPRQRGNATVSPASQGLPARCSNLR